MADKVNIAVLIGLVGGEPVLVEKFALKAIDSFEGALGEMALHLTANNITEFGMVSHKIKSVAQSVGACELAELLVAGSKLRTELDVDGNSQKLMNRIVAEVPLTTEELQVELEKFILGRAV